MSDVQELHWPVVMAEAVERFGGQTPRAQDEATVLAWFERAPLMVLRAVDEIAEAPVTWYWSALAARLERSGPSSEVVVSVGPSREQAVARAEAWIRNAGAHFPSWAEVRDELFGDRGALKAFAADEALQGRLETLWRSLQREEAAA